MNNIEKRGKYTKATINALGNAVTKRGPTPKMTTIRSLYANTTINEGLLSRNTYYENYGFRRRALVYAQSHISDGKEVNEDWSLIERCYCGRLFQRLESDYSRYQYCGRHPLIETYELQSGVEDSSAEYQTSIMESCRKISEDVAHLMGVGKVDLMDEMEGLVLLWLSLQECTTNTGVLLAITSYVRGVLKTSITGALLGFVKEILDTPMEKQDGEEDVPTSSWKDFFQQIRYEWKSGQASPFFQTIFEIVGNSCSIWSMQRFKIDIFSRRLQVI